MVMGKHALDKYDRDWEHVSDSYYRFLYFNINFKILDYIIY